MTNNINELEKKSCCGCGACSQICPKNAIKMEENYEGFLYPIIDDKRCINCGLCKKVCPILNNNTEVKKKYPKAYAAKNNNKKEIMNSSSGGIFVALAKNILKKDGVVYGAAYTQDNSVAHLRVVDEKKLIKLQGSKYVQSIIGETYKNVKEDLETKKIVLFSGTPCQVYGLKKFLIKEYDNLITIDLVCHGVPSSKLFKKYLLFLEKKYNKKIKKFDFRNKEKKGWGLTAKATFTDGSTKFINADFDPYYSNFEECNTFRESCYECKFSNLNRKSDITLADYWGILSIHNDFYDDKGVSLVLINNEKGERLLEGLNDEISFIKTDLKYASKRNNNLIAPSKRNDKRENIYKGIEEVNYVRKKLTYKINIMKIIKLLLPKKIKKIIFKIKGVKK